MLAAGSLGLYEVRLDGDDVYWIERRPEDKGRCVLVKQSPDGSRRDVLPDDHSVRTTVHEYGGGAYTVRDRNIFYVNQYDRGVYRLTPDLTSTLVYKNDTCRFADLEYDAQRNRIICVCEDHAAALSEPRNTIVALDLDGGGPATLAEGCDFYSNPRLGSDGARLACLGWNHPNMPWDGTELIVSEIGDGGEVVSRQCIAGGSDVAVFQPEWSGDGTLYFVSDQTGWWNLYQWDGSAASALCPREAEFGLPQWVFGMRTYAVVNAVQIVAAYKQEGNWNVGIVDVREKRLRQVNLPLTEIEYVNGSATRIFCIGASPKMSRSIFAFTIGNADLSTVKQSAVIDVDDGYLSNPETFTFPTEKNLHACAHFYPPQNREYRGPDSALPPCIVISHGGPTGAAQTSLNLGIQFWTSRGFAVVDVDYGGSTGYGKAYRQRLDGAWGVVDVQDCINAVLSLAREGKIDTGRLIIRGSSAGGFTTLCALTFHDVFRAGCSRYGIGDLEALVGNTHKFESRYEQRLIGPYPERRDTYRTRSPVHHTERLSSPCILLQGRQDKIVAPAQAESMVAALKDNGIPVAYIAFENEQHGFRQAQTIVRAATAELYFYAKVFGFALAEDIDPVPIMNSENLYP
ncbi:MAG: prolyl oligopeptidase family serine peptidase [Chitinivibrionales bacterium]|nr:prolyl oligopeptidase family serine peptidase [Chitinivibrionales bacterium]